MSSRHIIQTVVTARRPPAALCKTVNAYRAEHEGMEWWALKLLDRLAGSQEAAKAFEQLKLKDGREHEFVMLCVLVAQLAREFPKRTSTQQKTVKRLRDLDKAITVLRSFVKEQLELPSNLLIPRLDPLPMWGFSQPRDEVVAMMRGLELIAEATKKRKAVMAEYGATRKKNIEEARYIAAIRYLAKGVRRLAGKPHKEKLRDFVPVIFGREVPYERVTYALRPLKRARSRG